MRRRALLMGQRKQEPLIIEIDTRNLSEGSSDINTFVIPTIGVGYKYRVDWGDGVVTSNHNGDASHAYSNGGVYEVKIYGQFPRFYFSGGGDKLKIKRVISWGSLKYSTDQINAFYGCRNLTEIAEDENGWYNSITIGARTFMDCKLSYLPSNMTLANLTNGIQMFQNNSLTSLPDGMTLANLTTGASMFYNNSLTLLPDGMTLANLTNGNNMFRGNSLTLLPDGMTLANLTNGNNMFRGNSLTSLPDRMTLDNLTTGNQMFYNNSLTSLPDGMTLDNLTTGNQMFNGSTINTARYSQLLIDMANLNPNNDVEFHAGNSKYNSSAVTARAILTSAPRNWTITDGGLE